MSTQDHVLTTVEAASSGPPADGPTPPGIYVNFHITRAIPANVTVWVVPAIAQVTYPPLTFTQHTDTSNWWQVHTEQYVHETTFRYSVIVEVTGPDPAEGPIVYSTVDPVTVPTVQGAIKYVGRLIVALPAAPADKVDQINDWIRRTSH